MGSQAPVGGVVWHGADMNDDSSRIAVLASATFDVETKPAGLVTPHFCFSGFRKKGSGTMLRVLEEPNDLLNTS